MIIRSTNEDLNDIMGKCESQGILKTEQKRLKGVLKTEQKRLERAKELLAALRNPITPETMKRERNDPGDEFVKRAKLSL